MKLRLLLVMFATALLLAPAAQAAPVPNDTKNAAAPAIVLQLQPLEKILETVQATAKNFMAPPIYSEFEKEVLGKLDVNAIKGIDIKKPAGLYATIGEGLLQGDFSKTSIVALIPITDEKDFIALLGKIDLQPKQNGDTWSVQFPNAPVEATIRFLKNYAYISLSTEKLNVKALLDAKEVISDKETAAAVLHIRIDRIPEDLKKGGLGFLAQALDDAKTTNVLPEAKELVDDVAATGLRCLRMGIEEGKEQTVRLDLDPKTGAFIVENSLEAKSGTALAKSFVGIKPTKNDFADIVGPDSAAHILVQIPLFVEDFQRLLGKTIDVRATMLASELKRNEPREAQELAAEVFATLGRTVKSGNMDFAASLRGPDKNEQYTAVAALSVKDTAALEKALKSVLKIAPKEFAELVKVDAFKVEGVNVHEIAVGDKLPAEAQKIFGKSSVYVALAPNAAFVSFGAQAKEVMKQVLTSKLGPKPAPLVHAEISGKRLMTLLKNAGTPLDGPAGAFFEKFGKLDRISMLSIKVEGGDRLMIRQEFGIVPLMGTMGVARVGQAPAPPAEAPPKVTEEKKVETPKEVPPVEKKVFPMKK